MLLSSGWKDDHSSNDSWFELPTSGEIVIDGEDVLNAS